MSAYIPAELRRQVRNRFSNTCAYCQTAEDLTVTIFEIEHILPRAVGGETKFENLCLACPTCNRFKSDKIQDESGTRLFNPQRDNWKDHFGWSVDGTTIVDLSAIGKSTIAALRMNRSQMTRVRRMWVTLGEHPPNPNT